VSVSNPKGTKHKMGLPVVIEGDSAGSDFKATTGNCPAILAAGAKCSLDVTFMPMTKGKKSASLSMDDNASGAPQQVHLKGIGK
jgi:hypothetical protein